MASLKERQQLRDSVNAKDKKVKELEVRISTLKCGVFVLIALTIGMFLGGWLKSAPAPVEPRPVIHVIPFNSVERLDLRGHAARSFSLEWMQNVAIKITAQCQDCYENSLKIIVLDEHNYRKFEAGEFYDPIGILVSTETYEFYGALDRGRYYAVLQNTSDLDPIVVNVEAKLSYTPDNLSH
jgi:hypothetical protein